MKHLLGACQARGSFQAETAASLDVPYYPAPLPDPGSPGPNARNEKFRILLGPSQLGATSTRAGLVTFAREVLPALERELGVDAFEVRVVGEGEAPPELARPHPSVTLTGRIEPADDEFRSADVQLVPTPFALGKRVRIIVGWSFGCPVVAHRAEAGPLPELQHGENALLAGNGRGLAEALARLARDEALRRRIAEGGRQTYEQTFAPDVAARPIVERLTALAAQPVGAGN
jgi:glycosyltransferase involved in cell wall biosynthesis